MSTIRGVPFCVFVLLSFVQRWAVAESAPDVTFETHIRPIFRAHCFDCHGATEQLKGKLDLRLVRLMKSGGESGAAIVPGRPVESYLLDRVRSGEMPPGDTSLSEAEISIIEKWIAAGAKTVRPEPESIGPGLGVTPEERSYWAFQPVRRQDVTVSSAGARTSVDELILKTMPDGVGFSSDADRQTLIRRACFDLTGLPPTRSELDRWLNAKGDDWFDRLLTELLDSPHYGEHWGRHWLDVAGYADSEGYTVKDDVRPWAWKYRDWVIRAMNADMPFDRFLIEQFAGDELVGARQGDLTPKQIELLTATGFLRMAADGTGSGANNADGRNQVMIDTLKIIGTGVLGLSLQCAQCHDHRYDPIPQTDYYAIRAVFEPALDWQAWKVPNARRVSLYTQADRKKATEVESEVQTIAAEKAKKLTEYIDRALDKELDKYEEPLKSKLREAYRTAGDKRSAQQKQLLAQNPSVNINAGNLYQYLPKEAEEIKGFDKKMAEVRGKKPAEEFLRVVMEPANHNPETKLFHRGEHSQPRQTVLPAGLTVASPEGQRREFTANDSQLPTTGRRLAFAKWLTSGQHPLVARVFVNRVWMHHFGKGLVETPAEFGRLGVRPTHPELLDWLADEFVKQGWSLKKLHRLIMTSSVWRQSSAPIGSEVPFARKPLIRLEAETIRDRMLVVSGQLDRTLFGAPVAIKEDFTGQIVVDGAQTRRSLYIQQRRSQPVAMLEAFDAPVMETNCEVRSRSTVATQSLMLLNGEFILDQASKLAARVAEEATPLSLGELTSLPKIPQAMEPTWRYGYGHYDEASSRTAEFTHLPHFNGSQWQGGPKLPDPKLGYALLNANGGHPDNADRAVIRRWIARGDGKISINGQLHHPSENGDGVRGRVVSSRIGRVGEWAAAHETVKTDIATVDIQAGDTIDFITDARGANTSDSFGWTVTITLKVDGEPDQTIASNKTFAGPPDPPEVLAGQIVTAWKLTLCRPPAKDELVLAMDFAGRQLNALRATDNVPEDRKTARQVLTNLCQALMSSNEFLYID